MWLWILFIVTCIVLIVLIVVYALQEKKDQNRSIQEKSGKEGLQDLNWAHPSPQKFLVSLADITVTQPSLRHWKNILHDHVVWLDNLLHGICIGLLTGSHVLIEGVPWLAKTKTVHHVAQLLNAQYKRIQCTPDMLPSDITWWEIYNPDTKTFTIIQWPVFANIVLADEINRTTPKVQAALLEAMQEWHVTIAWQTLALPYPFFVLATQNPIEQEGTYLLPEAQLDRFLCKIHVTYPSIQEEQAMIRAQEQSAKSYKTAWSWPSDSDSDSDSESESKSKSTTNNDHWALSLLTLQTLLQAQDEVRRITISDDSVGYIVRLIDATRKDKKLRLGASPRASLAITMAAKAVAYMQERSYVTQDDIQCVAISVLRHRVIPARTLRYQTNDTDTILQEILAQVPEITTAIS